MRVAVAPIPLPGSDTLRSLVFSVINDTRAPVSVRNQCHRLMIAIEKNDQALVAESLGGLEKAAAHTGYLLPRSNRVIDRPPL